MNLHKAHAKCEGEMITEYEPTEPSIETTYVERRVPVFLEEAAHKMFDKFLADHGYDPEEI